MFEFSNPSKVAIFSVISIICSIPPASVEKLHTTLRIFPHSSINFCGFIRRSPLYLFKVCKTA